MEGITGVGFVAKKISFDMQKILYELDRDWVATAYARGDIPYDVYEKYLKGDMMDVLPYIKEEIWRIFLTSFTDYVQSRLFGCTNFFEFYVDSEGIVYLCVTEHKLSFHSHYIDSTSIESIRSFMVDLLLPYTFNTQEELEHIFMKIKLH